METGLVIIGLLYVALQPLGDRRPSSATAEIRG